ncbi:MAG: nitroreductase [Ignavibacteriae bacterium HGW-Ignavibacteriae-3]|nr:MAG: nitroreductase [Ignavibacteriae bacterium HGW-Ignavibacteriae-3]
MIKIFFCILFVSSSLVSQELKTIQLPQPQKEIGKPLMQALSQRQSSRVFDTKALPLQELSNLLWAACGINRPESNKRTVPSARNWQEVDVYIALPEGVYLFEPKTHTLIPVAEGDLRALFGIQDFVKTAPLNLVYISDYSRIKSNDDDETKLIWTSAGVGFIAQNVYLYCASQNLGCVVRGLIDKTKLAEALKLKPDQKIILSQTVGYRK